MGSLSGQTTLITGGGRGIGAATAKLFAEAGADVIICSRSEDELKTVSDGVEGITYEVADIGREDDIKRLFSCHQPDILINNAAMVLAKPFEAVSLAEFEQLMRVNVTGSWLCAQEAFKQMKQKGGGTIINVSSLAGIQGVEKFPGLNAYSVSKHAIVGVTEALAVEGRPYNIRVNAIAPGAVNTRMLQEAAPSLKSQAEPEDIATTFLFLADAQQSRHITGETIIIRTDQAHE